VDRGDVGFEVVEGPDDPHAAKRAPAATNPTMKRTADREGLGRNCTLPSRLTRVKASRGGIRRFLSDQPPSQ
jgi:hypothetical protein